MLKHGEPDYGVSGRASWNMHTGSLVQGRSAFVFLVRRVMVDDPELPFPESLAAAQIHKAGQRGGDAAKYLFYNMGLGAVSFLLGAFNLFAQDRDFFFRM